MKRRPKIPVRRVVNDAQVERLLDAMRRDVKYRSTLAKRLVDREGIKPNTAEYRRRYSSTMRRFQRYVTTAGEKRSFARAPVQYQREVRQEARRVTPPPPVRELPAHALERYYEAQEGESEGEFELTPSRLEAERDVSLYDLRAIIGYYDGELDEAAKAMNLSQRGTDLLSLATQGEGVDVFGMRGGGELIDQTRELFDTLPRADVQDIEDFHDLLMNLPDWQIGMILGDLEDSETTFADWLDAWRNDGMDLDADNSDYWALWRAAYARASA